jgi:hypothetical protein
VIANNYSILDKKQRKENTETKDTGTGNEYTDKSEGKRYRKVGERKQRTTEKNGLS